MKTLILSDFHFGTPASRVERQLDGIRALARQYDRVILNGDTLDRYEAPGCTPQAEALRKDIIEACSSRSGPPELVMGNHDPALSAIQWIYLEEAAALVFHGDCVADCTHPTRSDDRILAARLRQHWQKLGGRPAQFVELSDIYRTVQAQHLLEYPLAREPRSTLTYLLRTIYPPQKPFHILRYWRQTPRVAARLGATFPQPVRHVFIGHTHRAGRWHIHGITVHNTGSFMPMSVPCAASVEGAEISVRPLAALLGTTRAYSLPASGRAGVPEADEANA